MVVQICMEQYQTHTHSYVHIYLEGIVRIHILLLTTSMVCKWKIENRKIFIINHQNIRIWLGHMNAFIKLILLYNNMILPDILTVVVTGNVVDVAVIVMYVVVVAVEALVVIVDVAVVVGDRLLQKST